MVLGQKKNGQVINCPCRRDERQKTAERMDREGQNRRITGVGTEPERAEWQIMGERLFVVKLYFYNKVCGPCAHR